tara:strand:+ start:185 stop:754 length:570 start_codon:yes stop_codon:yes gene_type:complete
MVKESLSKLVSATAKTSSNALSEVSNKSAKLIKTSTKAGSEVSNKLKECCNPNNLIPCITAIILIAYMVVVDSDTVLDVFGTKVGKLVSMSIVLVALLFDTRLGIMLGLAVILSINMASVKNDVYESYEDVNVMDMAELDSELQEQVVQEPEPEPEMSNDVQTDDVSYELPGLDESKYATLTDDDSMMS